MMSTYRFTEYKVLQIYVSVAKYLLICGFLAAVFEWLLVDGLAYPGNGAALTVFQTQTEVFDVGDVGLTHRLVLLTCGRGQRGGSEPEPAGPHPHSLSRGQRGRGLEVFLICSGMNRY